MFVFKQGSLNFLTNFLLFGREKKLIQLRKLHHDKTMKKVVLHSFSKMALLRIKFTLFCTRGKPSANFIPSGTILEVMQKSPI